MPDHLPPNVARLAAPQGQEEPPVPTGSEWPTLAPEALHGPLGELVRLIEPHTEADPVAILAQALAALGSVIGRGPHIRAEADEHHGNIFLALVGETAKSRKGSSWGQVRQVFAATDGDWTESRTHSGLSSGEGLIWPVRDPITKMEKGVEVVADAGVDDKRLLVVEPELARTFAVMRRTGNTLSAQVRDAWDRGRLQSMTKNSPAVATGAHISIVGHITRDELLRHLSDTEAANGFGNRFLWLLVRRSKCLPDGGRLDREDFSGVVRSLTVAVARARQLGELQRDADARDLWHLVYPELSEGKPGLLGSMIARAEAQTMRLALLYALADSSAEINADHLGAALAIWQYCEDSARYIFGNSLGDPVTDEILEALQGAAPQGLTRSEIRELFSRHRSSSEIGRALGVLLERQLAHFEREETAGRPREVWFAGRASS